jgi:DNA transposition AAA+ family ATPase
MRRKGRSAEGRSRVLFVTADPTMTTVSLLRRVGKEAGVYSYESRTHELLSNIVARLKQENCLLIVDEAPHLSVKSLHTLRHIHDQTACGLLLMGATVLMQRTFHAKGRAREDLEQILSRVDQVKYLPGAATETDLASIAIAHGIHQKWHSLILPHVQRPREMLKLCRHAMNLRQLNPDATPDDIVRKALNEVFQAA